MPNYDSSFFDPPAPLAFVTLINPENNLEINDVPMLLDTGADVSLLPQVFVEKLNINLSNSQQATLAGFNDLKSVSYLVKLHLLIEGLTFRGEYYIINQDYGIIGRNILNLLKVQFDGKNLRWDIL